jgi:hypothetical protein
MAAAEAAAAAAEKTKILDENQHRKSKHSKRFLKYFRQTVKAGTHIDFIINFK